ncbi:type II toxin-antitoxin system ParD family antitoxin [Zhongshania guokunii]|uniref:Type II toxin-antitoxin system ParD family antitoxin n=1 Tax=Zhongshania guokunii TaxID=641783 RepID=A0ABV3U8B4_9GAMM
MARNTSITLAPHFDEFITAQFKNSRYSLVGAAQAALFAAGVNLTTLL